MNPFRWLRERKVRRLLASVDANYPVQATYNRISGFIVEGSHLFVLGELRELYETGARKRGH